ncbi:MAG: septum formation family protein [Acidimicrobiales bacterium]
MITASVAHAAPEVLDGRRPDEATDVYSLGSTIYTLLAGAPAFTSPTDESIVPMLARIATQPVPDLRARGVPSPICEVLEAAMAKDVADRIPTARAFSECMASARAASAGAPAAAPPPPPPSGATTVVPSLASGEVAVPPSPTGPPSGPLPPPGGPSGPLPPPGGPSGPVPPTGPPSGPLPPPTGPPSGPVPYTPGPAAPAVSGPVPPPGAPTPAPGVTSGPVPPAGFVSGPVPTAPPSRSSGGGKVALVVVLVVVLVALVAGGVAVVASRSTTSTPPPTAQGPPSTPSTPSTPPPTTQAPAQTRSIDRSVGDCVDHPNLQGVIDGTVTEAEPVTVVPCDQPHQLEVVGKETLQGGSGSPFPGDSQVASQAATACDSTFQDYVGVSLADSTLSAIFEYPSASEWADGERRVVCSAYAQDGSDLTGSVQGSLR